MQPLFLVIYDNMYNWTNLRDIVNEFIDTIFFFCDCPANRVGTKINSKYSCHSICENNKFVCKK